ncbi:MAG: exodeoxyribonuclease V subunit alpha [Desulfobacteraceae bacterium]
MYLERYWNYEKFVAQWILERSQRHLPENAIPDLDAIIEAVSGKGKVDPDQTRAVRVALKNRFTVISGGPGTGKTTTIARIIVAFHRLAADKSPRILLGAPTGKAAARMQEALHHGMAELLGDDEAGIISDPIEAKTLHRLLELSPGKNRVRYTPESPMAADVIIVDEASMIDLALMARLFQAVPSEARLILVGDKDQLASVEAGSVMGDICAGVSTSGEDDCGGKSRTVVGRQLTNHMVVLKKSYRFTSGSGIEALGRATNAGNSRLVADLMADADAGHLNFKEIHEFRDLEANLQRLVIEHIAPVFTTSDPLGAIAQLGQFKILTPYRKGPFGVEAVNQLVESTLRRQGVIEPVPGWRGQWYAGRPVMINRNDYFHHLFNGDVGITMMVHEGGEPQVRVGFPYGRGAIRYLAPEQLSHYETVYAMSVHKSQGTEFEKIVLILPDRDSPLLTRELIYTAVTRARQTVEIWGQREILSAAVERRIQRASGLRNKLWQM